MLFKAYKDSIWIYNYIIICLWTLSTSLGFFINTQSNDFICDWAADALSLMYSCGYTCVFLVTLIETWIRNTHSIMTTKLDISRTDVAQETNEVCQGRVTVKWIRCRLPDILLNPNEAHLVTILETSFPSTPFTLPAIGDNFLSVADVIKLACIIILQAPVGDIYLVMKELCRTTPTPPPFPLMRSPQE